MAVLGTEPALRVEQEVQTNAIAEIVTTHAIRGGELVEQELVGRGEDGAGVVAGDQFAGERLVGERVPVGMEMFRRWSRGIRSVRSAILGEAKVSSPLGDDRLVGIKKFEDDLPLEWIDTRASPCPSFFLLREFSRTFLGANVLGLFIRPSA